MSSNFKNILNIHRGEKREDAAANEDAPPTDKAASPSPAPASNPVDKPQPQPKAKPKPQATDAPRRPGRPTGKRSDENHVQVTAYIRRATHHDVKTVLLGERKGRDFSMLVEELLAKWLKSRT